MINNRTGKSLLINRKFQLSIIGQFSILALIITGVFYLAVTFFFREMSAQAMESGIPAGHVYFRFLAEQQSTLNKIFLICSLVAVIVILAGGLWLSHQVAGPMHRLVIHLRENKNSSGNTPPLKFRKSDYFPEVEEAFNEYIKK